MVIAYNDAARLPVAVASVLGQTLQNLEVVIVDDASTDDTWAVARHLAASDPRVRAYRLDTNSGSGSRPRNVGLEHVRAPWVMFLDSDDTHERHACKNLLLAAEAENADVAMGASLRFVHRDGELVRTETWYKRLTERRAVLAGVDDRPGLIYDTLCTNKLYRRAFLDEFELRFAEGLFYQDMLFTLRVYCAARKIVVLPLLVHRWNAEERSERPSVTRQRADIRNFEHRLTILRMIDEFLAEQGREELKVLKDVKFLRHDLWLYLKDLPVREPAFRERIISLARGYMPAVSAEALAQVGPVMRVAAHSVARGDIRQVLKCVDYLQCEEKLSADLVERDGRIYWCDFDPADAEARAALDVTDMQWHLQPFAERHLHHRVTALGTVGSVLRLEVVLTNRIHKLARENTRIEVSFRCGTVRRTVEAKVLSFGAERVSYVVEADLDKLPLTRPGQSPWRVTARTTVDGTVNNSPLSVRHADLTPVDGRAVRIRPRYRLVVGDRLVCATDGSGNLRLDLENSNRFGARAVALVQAAPPVRLAAGAVAAAREKLESREVKTQAYKVLRRLPVKRGSVVFEAYGGRRYADSPKYIYTELVRSGLPCRPVWGYRDGTEGFPAGAKLVRRGSWPYYYELARAEFWVDNVGFPAHMPKRPETTYLQTWHGTPLARPHWQAPDLPPKERRSLARAAVARWDALLVPSEFFVDTFVASTPYKGRLLRCGTPRNDRLVAGVTAEERDELRSRLELPAGRRIVLYAPTARSRKEAETPYSTLRLGQLAEAVGGEFFVLARSHHLDPLQWPKRTAHFARPVDTHHDVNDLLLVADVLVTDYSSVLFDFAHLGRPMIFFAYDRQKFERRYGTYLDVRSDLPGPVVATTADVAKCLLDLDEVARAYAEPLARFRERYGTYQSGTAARAVVGEVFRDRLEGNSDPAE